MSNTNIQEKYAAEFNEFLKEKRERVKRELAELDSLLNGSAPTISAAPELSTPATANNGLNVSYKPTWTWIKKITYFLNEKDCTTTEIADQIVALQPELNRSKVVGAISAILSAKSKKLSDPFSRHVNENGHNVYKYNRRV